MNLKRNYLSIAILIFLIAWCGIYVKNHINEFKIISQISVKFTLILCLLSLTIISLRGYFTKILLEPFKIDLKLREWFGLSFVSTMGNYLVPFRTGAAFRAVYLKTNYDFSYSSFLSTMAATYILNFFFNSIIGMGSIGLIYAKYKMFNIPVFLFFSIAFLILLVIITFPLKVSSNRRRFLKSINNIINGWCRIRTNRLLIRNLSFLLLLNAILFLLSINFAFKAFSISLPLIKCLLISAFHSFSILISITPGSLGISEGVIVFTSKLFGISPVESLVVAGLIRAITLFWVLTLGPIWSYFLITQKRKDYDKEK